MAERIGFLGFVLLCFQQCLSELIKCVLNIGTNVCAIDIFISQGLKAVRIPLTSTFKTLKLWRPMD